MQNLTCLIQEAWDAKDEAIRANQKEILCWCSYIIEFDKKTKEFMIDYKVGEKKAKSMIYDNLTKLLPPGTNKRNIIVKQTQRARNIYKLFEKIGIDKIRYITTYSANSLSELSDSQFQTIIDYFSKNPNTELPDDQESSIIDSKEEISDDQTDASEVKVNPEESPKDQVSVQVTLIPSSHVSNSSSDSKGIGPDDLPKFQVSIPSTSFSDQISKSNRSGLPVSILPENPEEKRKHIIGLVLEKFPYLSLDDSDECRDTFNLDGSTLCPLCNGDHKVNRSIFDEIKGEWGDGEYYGE